MTPYGIDGAGSGHAETEHRQQTIVAVTQTRIRRGDEGEPVSSDGACVREPSAIDLRDLFGARFRIARDARGKTWHKTPKEERVWLLEIRCRRGVIYPHGGEILAATTDRPKIGARLRRLPFILSARGDLETVVTFHVHDAEAVFAILKPYRRRRLSDAQRAKSADTLARARQSRRESLTQSDFPPVESTHPLRAGQQVAPAPMRAPAGVEVAPDQRPEDRSGEEQA